MSTQDAFPGNARSDDLAAVGMTPPGAGLTVRTVVGEDRCTLVLRGELDLGSRPEFDRALAQLELDRERKLVLDLGAVSFMDSSGVHAVMTVKALCAEHDCELLIANRSAAVQRLLEVTGLLAQLRTDGTVTSG